MIKYRGGKSKEFAQYERLIPRNYATYYEPFVGGGATFFKLMPKKEASCISVGNFHPCFGEKRCEHGARSAECLQRAA